MTRVIRALKITEIINVVEKKKMIVVVSIYKLIIYDLIDIMSSGYCSWLAGWLGIIHVRYNTKLHS